MKRQIIFRIIFITLGFCFGTRQMSATLLNGRSLSLSAIIYAAKMIMHECGHAGMAMLYDRNCVKGVHFFTHDYGATPIFSLNKFHVHADHLGGVTVLKSGTELSSGYRALFVLGGGIAGSLFCYCTLLGITSYCHCKNKQNLGTALLNGLRDSVSPFSCIINAHGLSRAYKLTLLEISFLIAWAWICEFFYAFTPNAYADVFESRDQASRGDGEQFWQTVLNVHGPWLDIMRVVSVVGEAGCLGVLLHCYIHAVEEVNA